MNLLLILDKPLKWVVLVGVLFFYLFMRAKHLPWYERFSGSLISAGLAYSGSGEISRITSVNELLVTVLIMLIGPYLMGGLMAAAEDQNFLKGTLQAWARNRLGVEEPRNDPED